ncbi:ExeM/NucH family extracellular endonuclease [Halioxenophilus aromaticivorans]|uniref:GlyGly-anchored extracellular endonuclease Xds n=1 Tax=Halioxenophilus aromaticivorans TaxID=1306992 RepID=A0AAV3U3M0_9ALTE
MNKWLLVAPVLAASFSVQADLMISGVVDGPLPNGLPKAVEIYVTSDITDLSVYGVGSANNGGGSDGQEFTFPAESVTAGSYIYVASDTAGFEAFFGPMDNFHESGAMSINGDDAIELFKNGAVIDVYGDINVDGTGEVWDHLDGWAYRNTNAEPNLGVFDASGWTYSGTNALDGETTNASAAAPMPIATFTTTFTTIDDGEGPTEPPPSISLGSCYEPATLISAVQGSGDEVAISGQVVVEGIVTGFNDDGFFVQEEYSDSDGDDATSEGIFIFGTPSAGIAAGSVVRVLGTTGEYYDNSQISAETMLDCGPAAEVPYPVTIPMPFSGVLDLESVEGMLAEVTDATIYTLDNFTRYGEINVSDGLKWTPSDVAVPLSPEFYEAEANADANILLIADDSGSQYPSTINYYSTPEFDGLNYGNAPRVGDTVTASGPVFYSFGDYRILPTKETFAITSKREALPEVSGGDVTIASFNVLNYFNGETLSDGTVTFDYDANRGAESAEEFELQQARIVEALIAIDADVVGLIEIENDGFKRGSAIHQLVNELNKAVGKRVYSYARNHNPAVTGTDAISNAIIYKHRQVAKLGQMRGIELPTQDNNGDTVAMRNALVQRFVHKRTGDTFAVVVNHFKSKGSQCFEDQNSPSELDSIQGSCNALRVSASVALGKALNKMWLPKKVLILGDLNAYSQEDPIAVLTDYSPQERGYTITTAVNTEMNNGESVPVKRGFGYKAVKEEFEPNGFSYFFYGSDQVGSLDHILASPAAMRSVVDFGHWNINALELYQTQYDQALTYYNGELGDLIDFTGVGPFRSSDHDPVIISLDMKKPWYWHKRH